MNADIIHDPNFRHGTGDGFRDGCHGAHCPAPITCRDVHRRYAGDWSFRKQIDAGVTVQEILDAEVSRERAEAEAAQAARAARLTSRPKARARTKPKRAVYPRVTVGATTPQQRVVSELNKEGLTDRAIAERIGKTREQVRATRRHLKLPLNRETSNTVDRIRELHGQGDTDTEIAKALGKEQGYISKVRRQMKLIRNVKPRVDLDQVRTLHGKGLTDSQIGEELAVDRSSIAKHRRDLELAPNKAPATPGLSRSREHQVFAGVTA